MVNNLNEKVANAAKWSTLAEILAKIAAPIVNMVLARILTPDTFGVVASISIVTSFADIFTDAGFQRYVIQHEYESEDELDLGTQVAFWTNLALSLLIYIIIFTFRKGLAVSIGCEEAYNALAVAGVSIICTSFSSTQTARFRRDLNFKPLFIVRAISAFIPLLVTIPLAFAFKNYWAMVIGTVVQQLFNAIALSCFSKWKPRLLYNLRILKQMLSFSIWNLLESLSIWFAGQAGIFIVARMLNAHYLGLYKTSMSTVNSYMAIVTASVTPVLYSALSRCQSDEIKYKAMFLKFERIVSILMFPMGTGMLLYRNLAVWVLLGKQWTETTYFLGLWAFMSGITITFSNTACEVYRSKGKPQISLLLQLTYLCLYLPAILISARKSFMALCIISCLIRIIPVVLDLFVVSTCFKISVRETLMNVTPSVISTLIMSCVAIILKKMSKSIVFDFCSIALCIVVYFVVIFRFPSARKDLMEIPLLNRILSRKCKKIGK